MKKIYQTRFGGVDKPMEEQGNCFQACVASILEIPLKEAFDCIPYEIEVGINYDESVFFTAFNEWLSEFGLACIFIQFDKIQPQMSALKGYHIAEVRSSTLKNGESHCVVIHGWELAHDPNTNSNSTLDGFYGIYLLVPLNVANNKGV